MATPPSEQDIIIFAEWFCEERTKTFLKDMNICMTPDENKSHAYMPAVMGCASFIELFAGLFSGAINPVGINNILKFTNRFLDNSEFTDESICLLFAMFRNKIAHVSRPYIFDSHNGVGQNNPLKVKYPQRRFTWIITATFEKPAIQITPEAGKLNNQRHPSWKDASYSHICRINLKRLVRKLPEAVTGQRGYLVNLSKDPEARDYFRKCMDSFYP